MMVTRTTRGGGKGRRRWMEIAHCSLDAPLPLGNQARRELTGMQFLQLGQCHQTKESGHDLLVLLLDSLLHSWQIRRQPPLMLKLRMASAVCHVVNLAEVLWIFQFQ
jgi:hypothetical protein